MKPLNLGAGLLPAQAAAAQIGAFSAPIAGLTAFGTNPALKSLTSALAAVNSPLFKTVTGNIGDHQSAADRLRPLFESAAFKPNAGVISSWLATKPDFGVGIAAATSYPHQSMINSIRPISELLGRVDHTSSLAKAVLGAGATNDALGKMIGFSSASAAVASIASFVKPYELPEIGLMTNLAATRSLLDTVTPLTRSVDRIGKGWASLGDRVVRGDLELAILMPSSNRLTTKAYHLDILVGQEDPTDDQELFTTRKDGFDFVAECLARLSMSLCDRWNGMWDRMEQRGADWQSQAANSAVELFDGLLKALAPDDTVRDWQIGSGLHNDPNLYTKDGKKGPTRRLKLLYLGHEYRVNRVTINGLFMDVPDTIKTLQGVKHGSMSDELFDTAVSLLGDVITMLVPNRRR